MMSRACYLLHRAGRAAAKSFTAQCESSASGASKQARAVQCPRRARAHPPSEQKTHPWERIARHVTHSSVGDLADISVANANLRAGLQRQNEQEGRRQCMRPMALRVTRPAMTGIRWRMIC